MAGTAQVDPLPTPPVEAKRKPTYEEFVAAIRRIREEIGEEALAAWDLDAEMEAEHQAILNGADL
jgi:hypothetical protein